jgi:hypothetical protein
MVRIPLAGVQAMTMKLPADMHQDPDGHEAELERA